MLQTSVKSTSPVCTASTTLALRDATQRLVSVGGNTERVNLRPLGSVT